MATSPNYGWLEPDNTDLVKNGALAIRTLGNAIDTTMATMVPKSIVDAKGDLIAGTAADTAARLAVGNNGETLVADSSTSTGLRWNNNYGQNFVINGNLDIWQRGTSFVSPSSLTYTADRWAVVYASTCTITQQTTGVPVGSTNCMRIAYTAANSIGQMATVFESGMVKMLAGRTVTLSVKLRRNASFSSNIDLNLSKNATANTLNGGTWSTIASTTISNASMPTGTTSADWYTATLTTTIPNDGTANGLRFLVSEQALGASGAYWEMAQAKLEIGSVATPMTIAGGTIQGETSACQRYYYLHASGTALSICNANYYSATQVNGMLQFPVTMRTAPSLVATSGTDYYISDRSGGNDLFNSFTIYRPSTTTAMIYNNTEAAGTSGVAALLYTNNSSASVAFSAEL